MIAPGQKITTKWSGTNKKWYESKGYVFTRNLEELTVSPEDLMSRGRLSVDYICDNAECEEVFSINIRRMHERINELGIVLCKECSYKRRSDNKVKSQAEIKFDYIGIYQDILNGKIEKFPEGYFSHMSLKDASLLVGYLADYLVKNGTHSAVSDISYNDIVSHKLGSLANHFSLTELFNKAFSDVNAWKFGRVPEGYWLEKDNLRAAIDWFINKLCQKGIVKDKNRLPKISYRHHLSRYGLAGITDNYNGSFSRMMLDAYPDKYNEWDFIVSDNFYKDTENISKTMKWFINQLYTDKIIETENDIPKVVDGELFKKYNLDSFFIRIYRSSTFEAINSIFPDRWKQWEYKRVPNDFWNNPQNVRDCLVWVAEKMITENIISSVEELLSSNLKEVFEDLCLTSLYIKYDVRFMYTLIYGEKVNYKGKTTIEGNDGIKLDSLEEKILHDILLKKFNKVVKPINRNIFNFINKKDRYVPDWIVNDNIIIEYFGLYSELNSNHTLTKYREKTHRKIEFFSSLEEYKFIPVYREDLNNNCKSFLEKISPYID